jgi:hypothetical protein
MRLRNARGVKHLSVSTCGGLIGDAIPTSLLAHVDAFVTPHNNCDVHGLHVLADIAGQTTLCLHRAHVADVQHGSTSHPRSL